MALEEDGKHHAAWEEEGQHLSTWEKHRERPTVREEGGEAPSFWEEDSEPPSVEASWAEHLTAAQPYRQGRGNTVRVEEPAKKYTEVEPVGQGWP